MLCFKDKTFCASYNCTNECGRKMTDQEKEQLKSWKYNVAYADFCPEKDAPQKFCEVDLRADAALKNLDYH